jgi:hypothetical protein
MKLFKTTPARLRLYRERAAKSQYNNDWRGHRYERVWEPEWQNKSEDGRKVHAEKLGVLGDYLGDWGEMSGGWRTMRDTTGFYADSYCYDVIKGGVERIRGARFTLYVPVTYCTGWDGVTYYMADAERVERGATEADHDTAKHEAANSAYHYAEREADRARDDHAKYLAEEDIADARAKIHQINKDARALLAEIRGREFTDNVCAALRYRLQEYLADRRRLFATIAEREDNYWSAVPC